MQSAYLHVILHVNNNKKEYLFLSIIVRLSANFFVLLASLISPFRERNNSSENL